MTDGIVDVVVLNWNGQDVIIPCLESLGKVADPPLRVMVVDNASTDGSADLVREKYPGIELVENPRNLLFAEGNNVGLRKIMERGGRYLLLLNNDTEVDPDFIREMMKGMDDDEAGIVGPKIFYFDKPSTIWYGGGGFIPLLWIPKHENIRKNETPDDDVIRSTEWVSGCAMLVRREVFEEIGLLDPLYTIYCEDVDLCLRAREVGWKCLYAPHARVWHKVSSSSGGGMTPFKLENRIASTVRLFRRFQPGCWSILMAPVHLLTFIIMLAGLLVTGRPGLARAALKGARRGLSER
ncbi:MAG: glycosyltransferase family 2 protein [Candidatus Krumholzibacteria bacterium]|nr:glycosyltransferase family 2 protein [Candidatus Krumholzibacteria bacterium]